MLIAKGPDARDVSGVLIWRRELEIEGKNPSPQSRELCREVGSLCESQAYLGGALPASLFLGSLAHRLWWSWECPVGHSQAPRLLPERIN